MDNEPIQFLIVTFFFFYILVFFLTLYYIILCQQLASGFVHAEATIDNIGCINSVLKAFKFNGHNTSKLIIFALLTI